MKVVLYKTFLCPRCFLAERGLKKLQGEFPELCVETVEVSSNPIRAWQDGVRMLPTVTCKDKSLSGLFLSTAALRDFLRS